MKRNKSSLFLSILTFAVSVLGLIFLSATAMISSYIDNNNWYRIFANGNVKWRVAGFTTTYPATNFPVAFTYLAFIGITAIVLGTIYWLVHEFAGKKKCGLTKFSLPGPIAGVLMGLGGLIGFIGSMVFIPYGNDVAVGPMRYDVGYVIVTVVFGLFLLAGVFVSVTSKKGKKSSKKKKR